MQQLLLGLLALGSGAWPQSTCNSDTCSGLRWARKRRAAEMAKYQARRGCGRGVDPVLEVSCYRVSSGGGNGWWVTLRQFGHLPPPRPPFSPFRSAPGAAMASFQSDSRPCRGCLSAKPWKNPASCSAFAERPANGLGRYGADSKRRCRGRSSRACHAALAGAPPTGRTGRSRGYCCPRHCTDLPTSQLHAGRPWRRRAQGLPRSVRTERPATAAPGRHRRRDRAAARTNINEALAGGLGVCSVFNASPGQAPQIPMLSDAGPKAPQDRWPRRIACLITSKLRRPPGRWGPHPGLSPAAASLGRMRVSPARRAGDWSRQAAPLHGRSRRHRPHRGADRRAEA